jgi:hypothetical protein
MRSDSSPADTFRCTFLYSAGAGASPWQYGQKPGRFTGAAVRRGKTQLEKVLNLVPVNFNANQGNGFRRA